MGVTMIQMRRVVEAGMSSALQGFNGSLAPQPTEQTEAEQTEIDSILAGLEADVLLVVDE